jgi:integrase
VKYDGKTRKARFEVSIPGTNGKVRRRATVKVNGSLDAQMKFSEFRKRVIAEFEDDRLGTQRANAHATFEEWVRKNWVSLSANMKPRTAEKSFDLVESHLIPFFGAMQFSEINAGSVEDFRAQMQLKTYGAICKKLYSSSFINDCLRQLHAILKRAAARNIIGAVPAFPRALREAKLMSELSAEEEVAFLAAFADRDSYLERFSAPEVRGSVTNDAAAVFFTFFRASKPFFVVALHTALRRGDLLNLEWSSVDLKDGHIRVVTQKTSTPVFIPLSATAVAALEECRLRPMASTKWVFVQHDGSRMSLTTLRRHFATAKELAGITRRFRLHDLRHTAASKMASAGISLQVIAKVLGHTSTRMSERYARPDDAALAQIRTAMERSAVAGNLNSSLNSLRSKPK